MGGLAPPYLSDLGGKMAEYIVLGFVDPAALREWVSQVNHTDPTLFDISRDKLFSIAMGNAARITEASEVAEGTHDV